MQDVRWALWLNAISFILNHLQIAGKNDNANNTDENEQDMFIHNYFNSNPSEDVQHDGVAGNADADDNNEESLQEVNVREVSPPDIEVTYGDVHEVVEVCVLTWSPGGEGRLLDGPDYLVPQLVPPPP